VFFSSNHGLGVFEVPVDDIFLYDCRDHWCPGIKVELIGESDRTARNDGLNCLGGSNPWKTNIKPFDCTRVSGIMKVFNADTGYDVMALNLTSGQNSVLLSIPLNRTEPPYSSISSVSMNPKDSIFYGVIVIGDQPYLVRFDAEMMEFCAKLPMSSGGYVGGSFGLGGVYFYTSLTSPPLRYSFRDVHNLKGYVYQNNTELRDWSNDQGMNLTDAKNATPTGMSGLVTIRTNLEGQGHEAEYVIGIDKGGRLTITKDNCSHQETWLVPTISSSDGTFGAAYTFDDHIYFEAKDGSGVYEVPLDGFNANDATSIQLKLAGVTQESGGTDFAGWSETGFNCMKSPTPFYAGDCQLGYHTVDEEAGGTCPAGSVHI
jgi:hypothetical protein